MLGGNGSPPRSPLSHPAGVGDCVTIQEEHADCDGKRAWYRVASKAPESGGCAKPAKRSEDGEHCLEVLHPVDVEIDVDIPALSTPGG